MFDISKIPLAERKPTLHELAQMKGYELRHHSTPLSHTKDSTKKVSPFDFSNNNGGTLDAFQFYTTHYLIPII